ncbi:MAG: hypothetical protein AAF974_06345 [Cyanobacteria bacterium P01_E01_bin.34]
MNLFKRSLLQQMFRQAGRHFSGWQDVGYITMLVLSALSAIAFLGEYRAQGEPSPVVEPISSPAEIQVQDSL